MCGCAGILACLAYSACGVCHGLRLQDDNEPSSQIRFTDGSSILSPSMAFAELLQAFKPAALFQKAALRMRGLEAAPQRQPRFVMRTKMISGDSDPKPAGAWLEAVGGDLGWKHGTQLKLSKSKEPTGPPAFITEIPFASKNISAGCLENLNRMGLRKMTDIQAETFDHALGGRDILARARTGTGKTVAFLLPVLEGFVGCEELAKQFPNGFHCLVISPTRELAQQICKEGQALIAGNRGLTIDYCIGGTKIEAERARMEKSVAKRSCNVLVGTPGRLLDHAQNTLGFEEWMQSIQVVILDEADRLLEMGFRQDIERILQILPKRDMRQSLLFSATVAPEIRQLAQKMLKPDSIFVDTVGEVKSTHEAVAQEMYTVPFDQSISALAASIYKHIEANPNNYKIMVFFSTARVTGFMSEIFNTMGLPVLELHSRKSQSVREKTTAKFKAAKRAVLFSSDVSARGMDFPDVSLIIQVGMTERDQYIHRLGRTARSTGIQGSGLILAVPFEQAYLRKTLSGLPIQGLKATGPKSVVDLQSTLTPQMQHAVSRIVSSVGVPGSPLLTSAERAYGAWLGYHKSNLKNLGWSREDCVEYANTYSRILGCPEIPALEARTVGNMGLKGVSGLNIVGKGSTRSKVQGGVNKKEYGKSKDAGRPKSGKLGQFKTGNPGPKKGKPREIARQGPKTGKLRAAAGQGPKTGNAAGQGRPRNPLTY